jgi:LysR family transcriptional regulator of gallate degradation
MKTSTIPNLRHLRVLHTVGRLRSVSRASEELNISQPAVTQAVAKLEVDLGVALFERSAGGTFPTSVGGLFLRRVERFFDILERALSEACPLSTGSDRPRRAVDQMITATHLRSLLATVDRATLADAVRLIGVSETSLYRSARDLEHILRRPLFTRTASGPVCNSAGRTLARAFKNAVQEIDYARDEVVMALGEGDPLITVGVLPMSGSNELAATITSFLKTRPKARIKVVDGTYLDLLEWLRDCRIDMIFGLLRRPDWVTDVVEEPLFRDSFCVVGRTGHPLSSVSNVTRSALADYDWIVPAAGTPRRAQIDQLFENLIDKPRLGIETSSLSTLRALLFNSDLLTVMTRSEVEFDESIGLFTLIDFPLIETIPPKGITSREGWLPTEMHCKFLELLRQHTSRIDHRRAPRPPVARVTGVRGAGVTVPPDPAPLPRLRSYGQVSR